ERDIERDDHRVLPALPELRALHAVCEDLLGQPQMRDDREAHVDEVARRVRERAQLLEALAARPAPQFVDDRDADACTARLRVDGERSHLGHVRTERGQLGAADDLPRPDGDDEAIRANRELAERSRQQVPLLQVRLDQCVQLLRIGGLAGAQGDSCPLPHQSAPTAPSAASTRASAASTSGSVMTSGGSRRTTVSAVRFTTTPRSRPAGATPAPPRGTPPPPHPPAPP